MTSKDLKYKAQLIRTTFMVFYAVFLKLDSHFNCMEKNSNLFFHERKYNTGLKRHENQ